MSVAVVRITSADYRFNQKALAKRMTKYFLFEINTEIFVLLDVF